MLKLFEAPNDSLISLNLNLRDQETRAECGCSLDAYAIWTRTWPLNLYACHCGVHCAQLHYTHIGVHQKGRTKINFTLNTYQLQESGLSIPAEIKHWVCEVSCGQMTDMAVSGWRKTLAQNSFLCARLHVYVSTFWSRKEGMNLSRLLGFAGTSCIRKCLPDWGLLTMCFCWWLLWDSLRWMFRHDQTCITVDWNSFLAS